MKTKYLILPLFLLAACQQIETEQPVLEEQVPQADTAWTVSIQAAKGEAQTKALDLTNGNNHLDSYWKSGETVALYKAGALLGTLSVTPNAGEKPTTATLGGKFTATGLAVNDNLMLLFPRATWDYTGQTGVLTGENSIEKKYAYAADYDVKVGAIDGNAVTTEAATFYNEQSIYRFSFLNGSSPLSVKGYTITAANGKLVQSRAYTTNWTSTYGAITVTPASATSDPLYVSLRNESTAADSYSFLITGSDDQLYMAVKNIPASVLNGPGKFIGAQSISTSKADFSPAASGTVSSSANIF